MAFLENLNFNRTGHLIETVDSDGLPTQRGESLSKVELVFLYFHENFPDISYLSGIAGRKENLYQEKDILMRLHKILGSIV